MHRQYLGPQRLPFVLALTMTACNTAPVTVPAPEPSDNDVTAANSEEEPHNLYLWSVSSPKKPGRAWLMGSVHIGRVRPEIDTRVWEAFQASDCLAVEVDPEAVDADEYFSTTKRMSSYPPGKNLRRAIGETLYDRVESAFADLKLPTDNLNRMRPWVVYHTLSDAQARDAGLSRGLGIDELFLAHARSVKSIRSVENLQTQMKAISAASETLQIAMLSHLLVQNPEANTAKVDELLADYMKGNDEGLLRTQKAGDSSPELAQFNAAMLDQRNVGMANTIEGYLSQEETCFVVVGAAHLVGANSVVQLLGKRGYTLERLVSSGTFAEIPAKGPGDRPTVRGYNVRWGTAASPPLTSWRDGKMVDLITAKSGSVIYRLTIVPLTDVEKTVPLTLLFGKAARDIERASQTQIMGRKAAEVSGARAQIVDMRGHGIGVRMLMTACDRKLYMLVAVGRAADLKGAAGKRVDKILDSFSFKL